MTDLKLFNGLPEELKAAVNRIVETVLGDEYPGMNDAFRAWQGETFLADSLERDRNPDLKTLEIEALAFRAGWEWREARTAGDTDVSTTIGGRTAHLRGND